MLIFRTSTRSHNFPPPLDIIRENVKFCLKASLNYDYRYSISGVRVARDGRQRTATGGILATATRPARPTGPG